MYSWLKILEDTLAVLSLGELCDDHGYSYEWTNGQKPCLIKNGVRKQCDTENCVPTVVPIYRPLPRKPHLVQHPRRHYRRKAQAQHLLQHQLNVRVRTSKYGAARRLTQPQTQKPNKHEDHEQERWNPSHSEIPEWLQEFRGNLVDERAPELRDSHASSSHEPSLEPQRRVVSGTHCI